MAQRKREALEQNLGIGRPSRVDPVPQEIQETIVEPMPIQKQAAHEMWERLADMMVDEEEMAPDAGYAMKKTGLLVTPHTEQLLTESQRPRMEGGAGGIPKCTSITAKC